LIPIIAWNLIFMDDLPKKLNMEFPIDDIPAIVGYGENILRVIVFALPLFMIFSLKTKVQKTGFIVYLIGIIIYFASWIALIYFPTSVWSLSWLGFVAPAYSTLIFFVGIGLVGQESVLKITYLSKLYLLISVLFVIFHSIHAYLVYLRVY
jgi:hypothetical protein